MDRSTQTQKIGPQLIDEVVVKMGSGYVRRPVEIEIKNTNTSPVATQVESSGESKKI